MFNTIIDLTSIMAQLRIFAALFLWICLTNNADVSATTNEYENFSSFFTTSTSLDKSFEYIVKIMSATSFDKKNHVLLSNTNDIPLVGIDSLNKEIITQLNFLSDKVRRSNSSGINNHLDNSYKLFGKFNGNENELGKITVRHAESMRLRNETTKYNKIRSLKPFEDFINSVLRSCFNIRETLLLNYLGLMDTTMSKFNEEVMTTSMEHYPDDTVRKQNLHSIYAALVRTEVQGFVTIAHAYWLRQLSDDGNFSIKLREIKDESIKRIKIYLKAVINYVLEGCNRLHTPLRTSTYGLELYMAARRTISRNITFFVKTASRSAFFAVAKERRYTKRQIDIITINSTDSKHSYIRKNDNNNSEMSTRNVLNKDEYHLFWAKWNENNLSVGKVGETTPLMSHSDYDYTQMNFFTVATNTAPGEWIIQGVTPPLDMGWYKASDGIIPALAVHGDEAGSNPMYICRAHYEGHLLPGYLIPGNNGCLVSLYGVSPITDYEVLIGSEPKWAIVENKKIPWFALVEGMDATQDPLGICRTKLRNRMLVGKVHSNGECWIADAEGEKEFDNYEIMSGK